ncbi:MAG: 3'-5' exonuclease [Anaerolineales bacterium]
MPDHDLENMVAALQQTGEYEVLRRFQPRRQYAGPDDTECYTALAVDVETTGTDPQHDHILQFSGVPFEYSPASGQIYRIGEPLTFLEDPGVPIPAEISRLTGLSAEVVRGQRIDDARVNALVEKATLVIAHHARFDRCFLEQRLPIFAHKPWACSLTEVAWPMGTGSTKLEFLLYKHCGLFFAAHTAEADCLALIHLLATPFPSGELPMAQLLHAARQQTLRIWATDAAFAKKDLLKARHYLWNPGQNGKPKAWYRDVSEAEGDAEVEWLRQQIYDGRAGMWKTEQFGAKQRYSNRV